MNYQYEQIDKYILGPVIGSGTFSAVRIAKDSESKTTLAVKEISKTSYIKNLSKILINEIKALSVLNHLNICKVVDTMQTDDMVYIIMPYYFGGDLRSELNRKLTYTEKEAVVIMKQLIDAISYAHKKGWSHGDLKLENILIHNKRYIICDWGFACEYEIDRVKSNGSLHYVSSEILEEKKRKGPEADVWALGVILYTLVSGDLPFTGTDDEIRSKIKQGIIEYPQHFSSKLINVLNKIFVPNPIERIDIDSLINDTYISNYCDS